MKTWKQILIICVPNAGSNILIPIASGVVTKLLASYGVAAVAAFGVATRIESLAFVIPLALGNVLNPFVGQNWGAKKVDRAEKGVKLSNKFVIYWGIFLMLVLAVLGKPIGMIFNSDPQIIKIISLYLLIVPVSYAFKGLTTIGTIVLSVLNKPLQAFILILVQTFIFYIPLTYLGRGILGVEGIFGGICIAYIIVGIIAYFLIKNVLITSMDYDYLQKIVDIEHLEDESVSIGYWIGTIFRAGKKYFDESFEKYRISSRNFPIFKVLLSNDGLNIEELCRKINLNISFVKRAVHDLVEIGYIEYEDIHNKNESRILLTEKGKSISDEINLILQSSSEILMRNMSKEEKANALRLLKKMSVNMHEGTQS